ncbi:MAG: DinB family protein [Terriglobales bacterium]
MPQRKPSNKDPLRHWLDWLLAGGGAHADFDAAVKGLPPKLRGARAAGLPHTPWQLLEHLRLAQWDILDFSRNPKYKPLNWPDDYWPKREAPRTGEWEKSVKQFRADLAAMRKLVALGDLNAPIPWGDGQTILREALLLADHNAYHVGQLVLVRRALGAWKE